MGRGRDCAEACVLSNVHQGDFNDGIVRERVVCHCGKRYHLDAGYVQIPVGAGTDYKIFYLMLFQLLVTNHIKHHGYISCSQGIKLLYKSVPCTLLLIFHWPYEMGCIEKKWYNT